MKIAILSDIHGNLEALTAVFAYLNAHPVGALYCLGDTIGYGANPNECCEELRRSNVVSLLGNHDQAVWDDELLSSFSPIAKTAMKWTRSVLLESEKEYLRALPLVVFGNGATFVHASLDRPSDFPYLHSAADARICLRLSTTSVCWIGHTHRPVIYCENGEVSAVDAGKKCIVNVGSVGQPRDGDPRLSFGTFDTSSCVYENIRLPYDSKTARRKIADAGLPARLGDRLLIGH